LKAAIKMLSNCFGLQLSVTSGRTNDTFSLTTPVEKAMKINIMKLSRVDINFEDALFSACFSCHLHLYTYTSWKS